MKRKFLLSSLIAFLVTLPSVAGVTVTESTEAKYLNNYGYSHATIEMVQRSKAKANGEVYVSASQEQTEKPSWIKRVFIYLDPALDNGSFLNHDTKTIPGFHDL